MARSAPPVHDGGVDGAADERNALKTTFDLAAERYERARPEYPAKLLAFLVATVGLRPRDRLLEVGCATGKATRPLAERGFDITCVELGTRLAAAARSNLAGFPKVRVINAPFESWVGAREASST